MLFKLPVVLSDLYSKLTRQQERPAPTLEVVASLMLSAREKVWVVEVGGSWLVLGSGSNGLTTLGHLHKGGAPLTLRPGDLPFELEQLLQGKTEKQAHLHAERVATASKPSLTDGATTVEATPAAFANPIGEPVAMPVETAGPTEALELAKAAEPVALVSVEPQDAALALSADAPPEPAPVADAFPAVAEVAAQAQHQINGTMSSIATSLTPSDAPKVETAEQLAQKFIGIRAEAERIDAVQTVGADEHGFPDPVLAVEVTVSEIAKKPVVAEPAPAAKSSDKSSSAGTRPTMPMKAYSKPSSQKPQQPEDKAAIPAPETPTPTPKEDPAPSSEKKPSFMALYAEVKNGSN